MQTLSINQKKPGQTAQSQWPAAKSKKAEIVSNLLFVVFNVAFFAALFLMLPALGASEDGTALTDRGGKANAGLVRIASQKSTLVVSEVATGKSNLKPVLALLRLTF